MKNILSFVHEGCDIVYYTDGRFTLCVCTTPMIDAGTYGYAQAFGQSFCMPTDKYDQETGILAATERLSKNLGLSWDRKYALYQALYDVLALSQEMDWNNAHNSL